VGTVYPTAHEPNDCKGINASSGTFAGMKVVITDANNKTTTLSVNSAGNFYTSSSFARPAKVKVVNAAGKERVMVAQLTTSAMGDCNSCHTQNGGGSPKAPGRVITPK
jgi:hypothetical protein